ncbi:High cysteine membrane protein [Giardia muris]|uniref:High cysteine membrane protein n=1 Tax=Giardia muris TaxID=5742 RepID=A0A4Z1SXG3_GIAMU|nr:High cysteine membrane protein [Giardia muris]|eukprot:TNJ30472.1 High cysteine membrane protein [Giardia muris]
MPIVMAILALTTHTERWSTPSSAITIQSRPLSNLITCPPAVRYCEPESCFVLGSLLSCAQCEAGFVPLDGLCTPVGEATRDVCTVMDSMASTATRCTACGDMYLLHRGGCYALSTLKSGLKGVESFVEPRTAGVCADGSAFTIPGVDGEFCKKCSETGEAPINGKCGTPVADTDHCTLDSKGACTDCNAGSGSNNYFLFYGGCYDQTSSPGSTLCKTVVDGKCTAPLIADAITFIKDEVLYLCSDTSADAGGMTNCGTCNYRYPTPDSSEKIFKCTDCIPGTGPISNSLSEIGACETCPQDCKGCADIGFGFGCMRCTPGKNSIDGICEANNNVCIDDVSSGYCQSCKNGYMRFLGACLSPYKASSMGICSKDNQFLVGEALVCKECKAGFVPIDGTCISIGAVNTGTRAAGDNICMKADGTTPVEKTATKCEACKNPTGSDNYFLFNGGCYPAEVSVGYTVGSHICSQASNGACADGKLLPTSGLYNNSGVLTLCSSRVPGCGQCVSDVTSGAVTCSACGFGYYGTAPDCKACSTVLSGCTVCDATTCSVCWDGSAPDSDGKCSSPPDHTSSSSSGLSGGAIAGIVIAVILVLSALGGLAGFLGWWFGCRKK